MGICLSMFSVQDEKKNTEFNTLIENKEKSNAEKLRSCKSIYGHNQISVGANNFVALATGTPLDNYEIKKVLGEGSFGQVSLVKDKISGVERAMKKLVKKTNTSKNDENEVLNEIEMLKSLDHPNIVKIFEFYNTPKAYYIINDFCEHGELFDQIINKAPFNESEAAYIMYQVLCAVSYCHNLNIIHRDLKPENILIKSIEKERDTDNCNYNIEVIDFGTAKIFDKSTAERSIIGSSYYIAPEVLRKEYDEKCDIWSCGVILYILLSGSPPFGGSSDSDIFEKVKKGKYDLSSKHWKKVSEEAKSFIKAMICMDRNERLSASEALSNPWFSMFNIKEKFSSIAEEKLIKIVNNIKKYRSVNKLHQVAWAFMVHNSLDLPEVKDLVKVFMNIDENNDGKITKEELSFVLAKMYNTKEVSSTVDLIFSNVDNDNNGFIEYEELIRATINKKDVLTESNLLNSFRFFDRDNSGEITFEEIAFVICPGKNDEESRAISKELIKTFDSNEDSRISFEEFKAIMIKLCDF